MDGVRAGLRETASFEGLAGRFLTPRIPSRWNDQDGVSLLGFPRVNSGANAIVGWRVALAKAGG